MPRTAEQNNKIKKERSEDILAASLQLFAAVGYSNVSVDLITSTVSCSHGLFYHYFKSVENIFKKLVSNPEIFEFEQFPFAAIKEAKGYNGLKMIADYVGSDKVLNDAFLAYLKVALQEGDNKLLKEHFNKKYGFKTINEFVENLILEGQKEGKVIDGDTKEIAEMFRLLLVAYVNKTCISKKKDRKPLDASILVNLISK